MSIYDKLIEIKDDEYAKFSSKLTPNIDPKKFLGIRVPDARKLAKKIKDDEEVTKFYEMLPHEYFDENMLHGILISEIKDYDKCIEKVDSFLPYVDNWAVCDIMSPKCFKKNKEKLIIKIKEWIKSDKVYTCRFGLGMLMGHYLDDDFKEEYLELPLKIHSDEYYINMMLAWFYATALAKQWDSTIKYIENRRLDLWVHNKTIQKARESNRITSEQKEYLKSLK